MNGDPKDKHFEKSASFGSLFVPIFEISNARSHSRHLLL